MKYIHDLTTGEVTELPDDPDQHERWLANGFYLLRKERNALLANSDWTVLSDSPTSTAAWKVYRQQLRDLPANTSDPYNPEWPVPPA